MAARKKVFLSKPFQTEWEEKMTNTLERAGFEFLNSENPETLKETICSIHFVGKGESNNDQIQNALSDFEIATQIHKNKESYKSFFWNPYPDEFKENESSYLNKIETELKNNMILSTTPYAIQFVEDILTILEEQVTKKYDTTPSDIFLICSETDQNEASQIQMILSDIVKMVKLIIIQETGEDYEELAAQQMSVCKLAVVYYKRNKNWATPFTQQLWKKVGGAGSGTPICLIGDSEINSESDSSFEAPKVKPLILPIELIPLEVKVQYDMATETN